MNREINSLLSDGNQLGWTVVDDAALGKSSRWSVINNVYVENSGLAYTSGLGIEGQTADGYQIGTYTLLSNLNVSPFSDIDLRLRLCCEGIGGVIGVMFAYQDEDNYYRYSLISQEGYRKLEKKEGGKFNELSTSPQSYSIGKWMTLGIIQQGGAIVVFLNGEQVAASNDNTFNGGIIALWVSRNTVATFTT